jgi:hypothetical protein
MDGVGTSNRDLRTDVVGCDSNVPTRRAATTTIRGWEGDARPVVRRDDRVLGRHARATPPCDAGPEQDLAARTPSVDLAASRCAAQLARCSRSQLGVCVLAARGGSPPRDTTASRVVRDRALGGRQRSVQRAHASLRCSQSDRGRSSELRDRGCAAARRRLARRRRSIRRRLYRSEARSCVSRSRDPRRGAKSRRSSGIAAVRLCNQRASSDSPRKTSDAVSL